MFEMKPTRCVIFLCAAILWGGTFGPDAWSARKPSKTVTAADGRPIRTVYIQAASADMENSAAGQLALDTCLTVVQSAKEADAVLDLGIALPAVEDAGPTMPNVFAPTVHAQTAVKGNKSGATASASATCTDSKGGSCSGSYSAPAGDLSAQPGAWGPDAGTKLDVSLTLPGEASEELWEPNARSKSRWSVQLRFAVGCPVCPGASFDRHKYKTYREWIQSECPSVQAR